MEEHTPWGRHGIDGLVGVRCKHAVGCNWTTKILTYNL